MEEIGKMVGRIEGVDDQIESINKEIFGNGRAGIRERLTRTEETVEKISEDLSELRGLVKEVSKNVGELTKALDKHTCDKDTHTVKGLFLSSWKDIVIFGTGMFIILHAIATNLPIPVLDFIKKILGIP